MPEGENVAINPLVLRERNADIEAAVIVLCHAVLVKIVIKAMQHFLGKAQVQINPGLPVTSDDCIFLIGNMTFFKMLICDSRVFYSRNAKYPMLASVSAKSEQIPGVTIEIKLLRFDKAAAALAVCVNVVEADDLTTQN